MTKEEIEKVLDVNLNDMDSFDISNLIRKLRNTVSSKQFIGNRYEIISYLEKLELEKLEAEKENEKIISKSIYDKYDGLSGEELRIIEEIEQELKVPSSFDEFGDFIPEEQINIESNKRIR